MAAAFVCVFGGGYTLLIVVIGTDHSQTYVDQWAVRWMLGSAGGLLTALLAGRHDRRYLPWTAAFVAAGLFAGSLAGSAYRGVPLLWVAPLLASSVVLRARAGRNLAPAPRPRRLAVISGLVTVPVLALLGAATVHVVLASRPTPLYQAMRDDPMAADRLPGLAVRHDWSKDQTTPFGIRSPAKVSRQWAITDGSDTTAKLGMLAVSAETAGWVLGTDPAFCGWRKSVDGHALCLVLRPAPGEGEVIVEITPDPSVADALPAQVRQQR